jgi:hypothetical protein
MPYNAAAGRAESLRHEYEDVEGENRRASQQARVSNTVRNEHTL